MHVLLLDERLTTNIGLIFNFIIHDIAKQSQARRDDNTRQPASDAADYY